MSSLSPISEIKRRASNHWNADGLPTLVIGVFSLLFCCLLPAYVTNFYVWEVFGLTAPLWILLALRGTGGLNRDGWMRGGRIVEWLKERISYPRTGYVEDPNDQVVLWPYAPLTVLSINKPIRQDPASAEPGDTRWGRRRIGLAMFGALISLQGAFTNNDWFLIVNMLWLGAFGLLVVENREFAWIDICGFSLAVLAFIAVPMDHESKLAIVSMTPGIVWTLRGALTLMRYLRRNPLPQADGGARV